MITNNLAMLDGHIENHRDVVVAHDAVHPDRGSCGGVGRCALMRTEVELEREITESLEALARAGRHVHVVLGKAP